MFPGGFHYHKRKDFMKSLVQGNEHPYIFHMSWTKNKENKQRFYKQMGEWFTDDACIEKDVDDIAIGDGKTLTEACCSAEPLFECSYRDKPSVHTCKDSDPIDKGGKSFW